WNRSPCGRNDVGRSARGCTVRLARGWRSPLRAGRAGSASRVPPVSQLPCSGRLEADDDRGTIPVGSQFHPFEPLSGVQRRTHEGGGAPAKLNRGSARLFGRISVNLGEGAAGEPPPRVVSDPQLFSSPLA